MRLGYGKIERLTKQFAANETRLIDGKAEYGKVEHAIAHLLYQFHGGGLPQLQSNLRVSIHEPAQGRGKEVRQNGRDRADCPGR